LRQAKQRAVSGRLLAEGPPAVREALAGGWVEALLATREAAGRDPELVARGWWEVDPAVMAQLADTATPSGLLAVCRWAPLTDLSSLVPRTGEPSPDVNPSVPVAGLGPAAGPQGGPPVAYDPLAPPAGGVSSNGGDPPVSPVGGISAAGGGPRLVVVCARVRDPGNLGAIIRCADAAGADAVVVTAASVDVTNPKTVRASAGSLFHLPIHVGADLSRTAARLRAAGLTLLAADGHGPTALDELDRGGGLSRPVAWLLGNEAWGLPAADQELADQVVRIPLWGRAESLNLACAAAICLYTSAAAQRRGPDVALEPGADAAGSRPPGLSGCGGLD
jgi:TrmH family RNA methyltransferase